MASDGTNLYWADSHAVYRIPVSGGTYSTLSTGWSAIRALALDATNVYWTDSTLGIIAKFAK